jgi:hypothetical protein
VVPPRKTAKQFRLQSSWIKRWNISADTSLTDKLNQQALGFAPLAAIAQNSKVDVNLAALEKSLSAEDFRKFQAILPSLGHVGEGHCRETVLAKR